MSNKKRYKIPNEFGEMSDRTEELSAWNKKFGSPAVAITGSKGYYGTEYATDRAIIFKLANGKFAFVHEWAPDSSYEYEYANIRTGLSEEEANRYMREYIHSHYTKTWFDDAVKELDRMLK